MESNIDTVMDSLNGHLDRFDEILRHGHEVYQSYPTNIAIDHDSSAQAHCTYRHILSKALEVFVDDVDIKHLEIRNQNLWLIESANVVIRFKKMDENGKSSNYPTKQAVAFDNGEVLPGLPPEPTRLTVGYLLDATGSIFERSQVTITGSKNGWCAAIIPYSARDAQDSAWYEVSTQTRLAV